jgi:trk system potassium uptake protein TrkA
MLSVEGHNVVVIDKDEEAFRRLGGTFNGVTLVGLGFDEEVLDQAGVAEADAFAAVTNLDNTNLMAAEVARTIFGVRHVVARLYNPVRERTYQQLGLDYVCGTSLVAESLMEKIKSGHGHHLKHIDEIEIVEFRAGPEVEGKKVADVEIDHRFRIFCVRRSKASYIPDPGMVLHEGDIIFGAVKDDAFAKIERLMGD